MLGLCGMLEFVMLRKFVAAKPMQSQDQQFLCHFPYSSKILRHFSNFFEEVCWLK